MYVIKDELDYFEENFAKNYTVLGQKVSVPQHWLWE
jgi:hypothetical protein